MIFVANFIVLGVLVAGGFALKSVLAAWGYAVFMAFCAGAIAGMTLYQISHRVHYGTWFDLPELKVNEPTPGAPVDPNFH